jgi:hypothetical protein
MLIACESRQLARQTPLSGNGGEIFGPTLREGLEGQYVAA